MDGQIDRQMDRCIDRQVDRQIDNDIDIHVLYIYKYNHRYLKTNDNMHKNIYIYICLYIYCLFIYLNIELFNQLNIYIFFLVLCVVTIFPVVWHPKKGPSNPQNTQQNSKKMLLGVNLWLPFSSGDTSTGKLQYIVSICVCFI